MKISRWYCGKITDLHPGRHWVRSQLRNFGWVYEDSLITNMACQEQSYSIKNDVVKNKHKKKQKNNVE